jgi:hypothetical protein
VIAFQEIVMRRFILSALLLSSISAPALAHFTFPFHRAAGITQSDSRADSRANSRDSQANVGRDAALDRQHDLDLGVDRQPPRDRRDIELEQRIQAYVYNGVR